MIIESVVSCVCMRLGKKLEVVTFSHITTVLNLSLKFLEITLNELFSWELPPHL